MVATFYPKVMRILKMKRAISYVEDNIDALRSRLLSQSPCDSSTGQPKLSQYVVHKRDVYGNPFYYRVAMEDKNDPDAQLDSCLSDHICVVRHTALYVCEIENFDAVRSYLENYDKDDDDKWFTCNGTDNSLIQVTGIIVSAGANHKLETPLLKLETPLLKLNPDNCPLQNGNCFVVPVVKKVTWNKDDTTAWKHALSQSETWLSAVNDLNGKKKPEDHLSGAYDDIIRYLPLSVAKANCPPTNIVANIDKFWVDYGKVCNNTATCPLSPPRIETPVHWIVSYAGDGLNEEAVRCELDADGGGIYFTSENAGRDGCHDCTGETVCELCYWDCAGRHQATVKYQDVSGGLKSLLFRVKDDTGQTILMKYAQILVLSGAENTSKITFNATAWRFESNSTGTFRTRVDTAVANSTDDT